jgi:hypothetical protein
MNFKVNNVDLFASLELPSNNDKGNFPLVIFVSGYGGSGSKSNTWSKLGESLLAKGVAIFKFDFSGQGYSSGNVKDLTPLVGVRELAEAMKIIKTIDGIDQNRIGMMGSSYGGYVALIYLALYGNDIKLLGLKSPVSDYAQVRLLQLGVEGIEDWMENGVTKIGDAESDYSFYIESQSIDIYSRIAPLINKECLIIHGGADTDVPVQQSHYLKTKLSNSRLIIIPDANHDYKEGDSFEIMKKAFVEWFSDNL